MARKARKARDRGLCSSLNFDLASIGMHKRENKNRPTKGKKKTLTNHTTKGGKSNFS